MHNVSVMQQVTDFSYCGVCGNMVVDKCEHRFSNKVVHDIGYHNVPQYDIGIFVAPCLFETKEDFTSHEYNCPINRTTVDIVLLYRAGFQHRFAYLVKYWDFSDILLFACNHFPPGVLRFTLT